MFDYKHVLMLGVFVVWKEWRKTVDVLNNTAMGGKVKQAVLDWIHRK